MTKNTISNTELKNAILENALNDVLFDGWLWHNIEKSCEDLGYEPSMARAVFPGGLNDVIFHFSVWADQKMLENLKTVDPETLRIRERIKQAVISRFECLCSCKEVVRYSLGYWVRPWRGQKAGKAVWKTADTIWNWAGDTSRDYNYYTKRGLLSGVIISTTMAWLNDESVDNEKTCMFLENRINNVLTAGKQIGKLKTVLDPLLPGRFKES